MTPHSRGMKTSSAGEPKYASFEKLVDDFEAERKEEAPNSFANYRAFFENYVLTYFLKEQELNNPVSWPHKFEDFRVWLLSCKKIRKGAQLNQNLSYASKNHCIKALNAFMTMLKRRGAIESFEKCRYFPESKMNRRDESSVISSHNQERIYSELLKINLISAKLFFTSCHTGMRLNEMLGLSIADFFSGMVQNEFLQNALKPHNLKPLGFIQLESQPKNSIHIRNKNLCVERKPLKGKPKIDPEHSRTIPIFDERAFNMLVRRWNAAREDFEKQKYGPNPKDYLLFDGINKNTYSNHLKQAQKNLKMKRYHVPHDSRHSFATALMEASGGSYTLAKMILGHSSLEVTQRYVHIAQSLQRQIQANQQLRRPMSEHTAQVIVLMPKMKETQESEKTAIFEEDAL
jgi:hypothetical protein